MQRSNQVLNDYQTLLARSRVNQFRFNVALYLGSLIIVGLAILAALKLADRLVRPVRASSTPPGASRRGTSPSGCRCRTPRDEISTLAAAFNRMAGRLDEQTSALIAANSQLDTRRAFIEAVLSSVTAGVLTVDGAGQILLINRSAAALLQTGGEGLEGRRLADLSPELAEFHLGRGVRMPTSPSRRATAASGRSRSSASAMAIRSSSPSTTSPSSCRPAPRGLVGHRAPDRARDQEPADPDPARRRAAPAPLRQGRHLGSGDVRTVDRHHRPPGRRPSPDGRRILVLRAHAQAGVSRREHSRDRPSMPCSCTKLRTLTSASRCFPNWPTSGWSATAARSPRR